MKELLEYLARELVDNPDAVQVTESRDDRGVLLQLHVDPEDMGKVIGRGGRILVLSDRGRSPSAACGLKPPLVNPAVSS